MTTSYEKHLEACLARQAVRIARLEQENKELKRGVYRKEFDAVMQEIHKMQELSEGEAS